MQREVHIKTLNEEGDLCEGRHDHCCSASEYILTKVTIAMARSDGWKKTLREVVESIEARPKNKMWIVDRIPPDFRCRLRYHTNFVVCKTTRLGGKDPRPEDKHDID